MSSSPLAWGAVTALILVLLVLDVLVLHRRVHVIELGEALRWSVIWFLLGLGFGIAFLVAGESGDAESYWAGYLIERALSIDNVFVFAVILAAFSIPGERQNRLLSLGILGALVLRLIFIVAGAAAINAFDWVLYAFGALLVGTGVRLATNHGGGGDPAVLRWVRRYLPAATPWAAALVAVIVADLVFAVDSVPAILSVTTDTFIVFASNAFAVLGLRPLYFVLTSATERFAYLHVGLGVLLVFVGVKMLLADVIHLSPGASLAAIAAILVASIVGSLWKERADRRPAAADA